MTVNVYCEQQLQPKDVKIQLFGILKFDLDVLRQLVSKMNKFWWLLKTLGLMKYPLKIKSYVYFA